MSSGRADVLEVTSQTGTVCGKVELDPAVFSVEPKLALMHQVVTAQLAARRAGTQSTKTRAEVSGGGAKPYRQKGTGRARQGSIRAPHYKGGGIALGPKPRSYRQRTPKKMVQQALRGALADRAAEGRVRVVDSWSFQIPSTRGALAALEALGARERTLVVLSRKDETAYKSFRNIPWVDVALAGELAAYDVLCADWVVFTRETLPGQNTWVEVPKPPETTSRQAPGSAGEPSAEDAVPTGGQPDGLAVAAGEAASRGHEGGAEA
jgi:large subunit ribosomal protein L4